MAVVDRGVVVVVVAAAAAMEVEEDVDVVVAVDAPAVEVVERRNQSRSLQMNSTKNWITIMPKPCKHPEMLGM